MQPAHRIHVDSVRDLAALFLRHRIRMLVVFFGTVIAAVVTLRYMPDTYVSEAKLLVKPAGAQSGTIRLTSSIQEEVNSELEILTSSEILEEVVDKIGPTRILGDGVRDQLAALSVPTLELGSLVSGRTASAAVDRHRAIRQLRKHLSAGVMQPGGSVITVTYESASPEVAHETIDQLLASFLEKHIAVHSTPRDFSEFLGEELKVLRKNVDESAERLEELRDTAAFEATKEQHRVTQTRVTQLEVSLTEARVAITQSRAKIGEVEVLLTDLDKNLPAESFSFGADSSVADLRGRLNDLLVEEADVLSKYSPQSRQALLVRAQIEAAETLLEGALERLKATFMFERRQASLIAEHATLAGLEAKEAALGEQLRSARESLARLEQGIEARHGRTAEIARLERDLELDRAKQRRYTESLDQARIDQRLEERKISNIGIVQAASVPLQPVGPRRTLMLAVAVLVALFLSAGVALFSEYLDESISSPERVRLVLEVPTLASVPTLRSFRKSERLDRAYADYRDLLLLRAARSPHRPIVVALVATRTGAGTSTVAASLAESLARNADTPVLLVDADFRDAALTRAFGQNDQPGLSDLLRQSSSSGRIQYPRISSNLYLLAAGTVRSALGSLVSAEDFRSRLGASYAWSHVIIDLPAVSETRAAIALAASCDGVAIVVNSRRSRHSDELGLKNALVASGAAVDGVILNQHESPLRPLVEPPLAVVIS